MKNSFAFSGRYSHTFRGQSLEDSLFDSEIVPAYVQMLSYISNQVFSLNPRPGQENWENAFLCVSFLFSLQRDIWNLHYLFLFLEKCKSPIFSPCRRRLVLCSLFEKQQD